VNTWLEEVCLEDRTVVLSTGQTFLEKAGQKRKIYCHPPNFRDLEPDELV